MQKIAQKALYILAQDQTLNKRSENESMKEGNRFVQSLFKRRNAIAHQNDRSHDSGIQDDIEKLYVVDNIETVKKIK